MTMDAGINTSELRRIAQCMTTVNAATLVKAADILDGWPQGQMGFTITRFDVNAAHMEMQLLAHQKRLEKLEARVNPVYANHVGPRYRFASGESSCSYCGHHWTKGPFCRG